MNIVIVTPFFNEKVYGKKFEPRSSLIYLAKESSKYEKLIIISSKIENASDEEIINSKLKIYRFKPNLYFSKLPYTIDLFQFRKILRICRKENCNVLIGNSLQFFSCFSAAIASKIGGYPFICRIIGASRTTKRFSINLISKIYDFTLAKLILKISTKIFVQSSRMQLRALNLGAVMSKITIIEDGVDVDRNYAEDKLIDLKKELGIKDSDIVITFVSRLYKLKGIEDLIDVANKLMKDYDNILFIIAGTGPLEKKLKIETKNEDRIKILGYRNDVPQILALSNIYAQPSYSEGLSPAILEACSYGLPIVSTYVGANPDLIINGINGFLIRPGDKIMLQKYLSILIDNRDLRVKMGKINKDLIKNNYDLKKTVKKFLSVLRKTTYTYYF